MRRLHLFEWEDQHWLPHTIRDFLTDQLRFVQSQSRAAAMQRAIGGLLQQALERAGTREVVDLCAGAGGPLLAVQKRLRDEAGFRFRLTMTDLFPNAAAFERIEKAGGGEVQCHREPVSVFDVPAGMRGLRTLCTALHHFRPADAHRILQDAVDKRCGIAIFEPLDRGPKLFLLVSVGAFFASFLTAPFVGRMTVSRFVLTYLLPLCPLAMAWDGAVSVLRSYSVPELEALTADLGEGEYSWAMARMYVPTPLGGMPLTYLIGLPLDKGAVAR